MGCVNESGCLGPKRRERDVYADLLDAIHEEAQKVQFANNLNIYMVIRQKLAKKGYVRKLLDNLTSHRSKINECFSHNLRITTQSKRIENKYAGLIVLNQIVNNLFPEQKQPEPLTNTQKTIGKSSSSQQKQFIDQQTKRNSGVLMDSRIDLHFFWLIRHLLENQGRMYQKILQSISIYCANRKEKIVCRAQTCAVLQLILQKMQRGTQVELSANAFLALIQQLKESSQEQMEEQQLLLAFIKLWLKTHGEGELYEASDSSIEVKLERIIKVLINRSISSSKHNNIYRALFIIQDQEKFQGPKVSATQRLLFRIIQENDFHSPVMRGIFLYMLQYLSSAITKDKNTGWKVEGADQFNSIRYPRLMDKSTRLKAFQTLRRWGENQFINLQQYTNFSASTLVRAYSVNLSNQKEYTQQIMRQFLKLTEQFKHESNLLLISLLMEEIRYQNADENLRQVLIILVREVIEARRLLDKPPKDNFAYFIPIDSTFSRDSRLQLIQLMGFISKHFSAPFYSVKQNLNSQFLQNLSQFLYTAYESMISSGTQPRSGKKPEEDEILFKYQFANSIISFLKCLTERGAYPLVLAYITSINSSLSDSLSIGKVTIYFLIYILYEGIFLLNPKQKIPDKMAALNFRLAPSLRAAQVKPQIQKVTDQLIGSRGQLIDSFTSNISTTATQLSNALMISLSQYKQANNMLSDYFKSYKQKGSFYMQTSLNQFKRQSRISSINESQRANSKIDDESFKDVLDKINQI